MSGPADAVALAEQAADDLKAAGKVTGDLVFTPGESAEITVDAEIAPAPRPDPSPSRRARCLFPR